jgi:hypothetical protein
MTRGALIVAAAVAACGNADAPGPARARNAASARLVEAEAAGRTVVAEVNGRPIYDDCVTRQAAAHGLDVRAALDECIAFELLALEAETRGYAADPEVQAVRKREAARALLQRDFEATYAGPDSIPSEVVAAAWRSPGMQSRFNHPEYRWCVYARANVPRSVATGAPEDDAAKAAIKALRAPLAGRRNLSKIEFFAAAERAAEAYPLEIQRKSYNTPRVGRAEANFAGALFAIPEAGMVSEIARTEWGWDLILLTKIVPARQATFADAEAELRHLMWDAMPGVCKSNKRSGCEVPRQRLFREWAAQIAAGHTVVVDDELIAAMTETTPDGEPALP